MVCATVLNLSAAKCRYLKGAIDMKYQRMLRFLVLTVIMITTAVGVLPTMASQEQAPPPLGSVHISDGFYLSQNAVSGDFTIIEFSEKELQELQANNLTRSSEILVGATLVLPGTLSDREANDMKQQFISEATSDISVNKSDLVCDVHIDNRFIVGHNVTFMRVENMTDSHREATPTAFAMAQGGITISISETRGVSNQFTSTMGLSAAGVSAGVGFSVTETRNVTISGSWLVPSNYGMGRLDAFVLFSRYQFQTICGHCMPAIQIGQAFRVNGGVLFTRTRVS